MQMQHSETSMADPLAPAVAAAAAVPAAAAAHERKKKGEREGGDRKRSEMNERTFIFSLFFSLKKTNISRGL